MTLFWRNQRHRVCYGWQMDAAETRDDRDEPAVSGNPLKTNIEKHRLVPVWIRNIPLDTRYHKR